MIALGEAKAEVLTANGECIRTGVQGPSAPGANKALPDQSHSFGAQGAGQPNPYCSAVAREEDDPSENARSVGILLTFGKFRFIDLGDLTGTRTST